MHSHSTLLYLVFNKKIRFLFHRRCILLCLRCTPPIFLLLSYTYLPIPSYLPTICSNGIQQQHRERASLHAQETAAAHHNEEGKWKGALMRIVTAVAVAVVARRIILARLV